MATLTGDQQSGLWQAINWTLRVTVALQCLANWRWMTQLEETPLLHWMLDPADIGGLAWSESTALAVQQVVGWLVLLAGGLVLWRPVAFALISLCAVQLLITLAMWRIAEGYPLQATWVPAQWLMLFPFATQLGRVVAPLGLLLISREDPSNPRFDQHLDRTMQLLRYSVAIVFLAHGIEAWQQNPKFLDLLINASTFLFDDGISESTARKSLTAIGSIDVILAFAILGFRSRRIMGWMAFWGLATAVSRTVANGWSMSGHETLARAPHFGLPLAVVLWWRLLECREATRKQVKEPT